MWCDFFREVCVPRWMLVLFELNKNHCMIDVVTMLGQTMQLWEYRDGHRRANMPRLWHCFSVSYELFGRVRAVKVKRGSKRRSPVKAMWKYLSEANVRSSTLESFTIHCTTGHSGFRQYYMTNHRFHFTFAHEIEVVIVGRLQRMARSENPIGLVLTSGPGKMERGGMTVNRS